MTFSNTYTNIKFVSGPVYDRFVIGPAYHAVPEPGSCVMAFSGTIIVMVYCGKNCYRS